MGAAVVAFFKNKLAEASTHRFQRREHAVLGRLRVEVDARETLDIPLGEHAEVEQLSLDLVEQIRVRALRQQCGLVVRLEGLPDLVGLVGEVEHHRARLARVRAVQAGQRLHRVHPAELLVHIHRVEQWLVETGLKLVGDDQEAVVRFLELGRGLTLADHPILSGRVHAGLRVGRAAIVHRPGEGNERFPWMAFLSQVAVHGELGTYRMQARARHEHGLGLTADFSGDMRREVLHADGDLLVDGVGVQFDEGLEQILGLALVVARVVLDRFQQAPVRLVGRVACQHVENEPFLDRLAHRVAVEGLELSVRSFPPKEFESLGLRGCGEREGREVGEPSAEPNLLEDAILDLLFRGLGCRLFLFGLF